MNMETQIMDKTVRIFYFCWIFELLMDVLWRDETPGLDFIVLNDHTLKLFKSTK